MIRLLLLKVSKKAYCKVKIEQKTKNQNEEIPNNALKLEKLNLKLTMYIWYSLRISFEFTISIKFYYFEEGR